MSATHRCFQPLTVKPGQVVDIPDTDINDIVHGSRCTEARTLATRSDAFDSTDDVAQDFKRQRVDVGIRSYVVRDGCITNEEANLAKEGSVMDSVEANAGGEAAASASGNAIYDNADVTDNQPLDLASLRGSSAEDNDDVDSLDADTQPMGPCL